MTLHESYYLSQRVPVLTDCCIIFLAITLNSVNNNMGGTGFCFILLLNLPSKNLVLPSIHWSLACFISLNLRSHTFLLYIPSYFTHFAVIVNRCFLIYVSNWSLLLEWIKTTTTLKVKVSQLWLFATPDSLQLYSPWNSPGQNTKVGNLSLLQQIFPIPELNPGLP